MYRKILIATDGSVMAARAAATGLDLAGRFAATVHVVHVVDTRTMAEASIPVHDSLAPRYAALLEALRAVGEQVVRTVRGQAEKLGVAVETEVISGTPTAGILAAAEKTGADLVVMGTHGRGTVGTLLIGSTAYSVLHRAGVPVLLVR